MSIQKRLFLLMSILCAILLCTQSVSAYMLYQTKLENEYTDNIRNFTTLNAKLVNAFTQKVDECLTAMANDRPLYDMVVQPTDGTFAEINSRSTEIKSMLINRILVPLNNYTNDFTYTFYAEAGHDLADYYESFTSRNAILSESRIANRPWYADLLRYGGRTFWFVDPDEPETLYAGKEIRATISKVSIAHVGTMVLAFNREALFGFVEASWFTSGTSMAMLGAGGELLTRGELPREVLAGLAGDASLAYEHLSRSSVPVAGRQRIGEGDYILGCKVLRNGWILLSFTPFSDLRARSTSFLASIIPVTLFILALVFIGSFFAARGIAKPIRSITQQIRDATGKGDYSVIPSSRSGITEIRYLYTAYGQLLSRIQQQMTEIYQKGVDIKQAELMMLQAQINPHFLYNTLDSISWAALDLGDSNIPRVISSLSKLLRYSIKEPDRLVMLSDELDIVHSYIDIQEFCYSLDIEIVWQGKQIEPTNYLPKLTLQPLFENAILHGILEQGKTGGKLLVRTESDESCFTFEVLNEGQGDVEAMRQILELGEDVGKNGIRNVNTRLKMLFGNSSGLSFENTADGYFAARVTIMNEKG